MVFFIPALLIALLLEGTVTTLPLVLIVLLCWTSIRRDANVFSVAFFAGIMLDIVALHTIGQSSLFFTIMIFLVFLYQRKYEINSYPFVVFATFFGSLVFLFITGQGNWFLQSFISAFFAFIIFGLVRFFAKASNDTKYIVSL